MGNRAHSLPPVKLGQVEPCKSGKCLKPILDSHTGRELGGKVPQWTQIGQDLHPSLITAHLRKDRRRLRSLHDFPQTTGIRHKHLCQFVFGRVSLNTSILRTGRLRSNWRRSQGKHQKLLHSQGGPLPGLCLKTGDYSVPAQANPISFRVAWEAFLVSS